MKYCFCDYMVYNDNIQDSDVNLTKFCAFYTSSDYIATIVSNVADFSLATVGLINAKIVNNLMTFNRFKNQ